MNPCTQYYFLPSLLYTTTHTLTIPLNTCSLSTMCYVSYLYITPSCAPLTCTSPCTRSVVMSLPNMQPPFMKKTMCWRIRSEANKTYRYCEDLIPITHLQLNHHPSQPSTPSPIYTIYTSKAIYTIVFFSISHKI